MAIDKISPELRTQDKFHHIDMGFLNKRLCITALLPEVREYFREHQKPGTDHFTELNNAHLLVTSLLDCCKVVDAPTLLKALTVGKPRHLFCSTERLEPCPEIYDSERVCHGVRLDIDFGKPVVIAYHTSHIVSSTGRMVLARGADRGYLNSIVGLVHDKGDRFEIEPLVIGAPWFDHPRNGDDSHVLMWAGGVFGEVLAEDIDQFSRMREVTVRDTEEWMEVMRTLSEDDVKRAITKLLNEPPKKDWAGERDDHFSASISLRGQRRTAAFLLKGPSPFQEMTLDMCGRRADQIHRMVDSGAEVCVVQHSHLIGPVVRRTLRAETIQPGHRRRKYCLMDGQVTYRILKAYSLLQSNGGSE
ncbi:MAG: hypothetical protein F4Y02_05955 [Chloroflexi bacterium]|nr:hypothetical protein [Chloroflexota bacterium]